MKLLEPVVSLWKRIYRQNILVCFQIWTDSFPIDAPKEHRLLEKILLTPILAGRALSLSNLAAIFPSGRPRYWFIDLYVIGWLLALITLLFTTHAEQYMFAAFASYRVVDILAYQLCVILIDSQNSDWKLASVRSSFLSSLVNLFEIVCAFSILYLSVGTITNSSGDPLTAPISAFYYSLVTMATLGYGEYFPKGTLSQGLVVAQILSELLFLVVFVPVFSANIVTQLQAREFTKLEERREQEDA